MKGNKAQLSFTFDGTGRRAATPSRPLRHGRSRWWRGRIHIEGVTLRVLASPEGIKLPTDVTLDADLHQRVEAYLTAEAAELNRQRGGYPSQKRGGVAA